MTSRLDREREFFDHAPELARKRVSKYYAITRSSTLAYEGLLRELAEGRRMLEIGCGEGTTAIRLAGWGARVDAIDLSEARVAAARDLAEAQGVQVAFTAMDAEALTFPDDEFDVVCGQAILHHLDVGRTLAEVVRVLRPDGRAVFVEPLGHNPLINLYRRLTPAMRTPDERPLVSQDLARAGEFFERVDLRFFHLASFAAVPFVRFRWFDGAVDRLESLDRRLLGRVPALGRYAWRVVLDLSGPRKPAAT